MWDCIRMKVMSHLELARLILMQNALSQVVSCSKLETVLNVKP